MSKTASKSATNRFKTTSRKRPVRKLTRVRLDDDTALLQLMKLGNFKSKRAAAETALRELIQSRLKLP
jgi:hypothetical protein